MNHPPSTCRQKVNNCLNRASLAYQPLLGMASEAYRVITVTAIFSVQHIFVRELDLFCYRNLHSHDFCVYRILRRSINRANRTVAISAGRTEFLLAQAPRNRCGTTSDRDQRCHFSPKVFIRGRIPYTPRCINPTFARSHALAGSYYSNETETAAFRDPDDDDEFDFRQIAIHLRAKRCCQSPSRFSLSPPRSIP
ncbi:hypothetical protein PUN28_016525 [Cardiocondyla obscurior]|uniref:Uncharacterized protein n=1 Tax=Cardiocondyla obscurior TaxID=286306 RepID=A0AAW2ESX0_9HYME